MPKIAGIDIPNDKRVEIGLTYICGVGRSRSNKVLEHTGIEPYTRVRELTEAETSRIREFTDKNYEVEGDLRRRVNENFRRLKEIGCYRGIRHRRNLPVRGQRIRTNARTQRGPRRTVPGRGRRRGMKKK